jgi:ribosomal protein S18
LDLISKSQQILALARARWIWDFRPLGAKARATPVDFSDAQTLNPYVKAHQKITQRPIVAFSR